MKKENLEKCREVALLLLSLPIVQDERVPFVVHHPFFDNIVTVDENHTMLNLLDGEDVQEKAKKFLKEHVLDTAKSYDTFLVRLCKPYYPIFFKLTQEYIDDEKEYAEYLSYVWTATEFPNEDKNVTISDWKRFFKKANKEMLMDKGELCVYTYLPETVTLYRGSHNKKHKKMSYTTNYAVALWFAKRFSQKGDVSYIIKTTIPKKAIYAYFSAENECVVNPQYIKEYEVEEIINDGRNEYPMFNEHH